MLLISELELKAKELRKSVLDMCARAGTGHVTSSFSCVEILVSLYYQLMRFDPSNPKWRMRDRFILSKGQASPILYAILADLGFFPKEWMDEFCQENGHFGVHLQHDVPGVEITAGSLGHGFGIAAGKALAAKNDKAKHLVFTILGDGECYEGSIWETAMWASHNRLNNLVAFVDRNYISATNFVEDALSIEPFEEKWKAFGWDVVTIDGHNFRQIFKVTEGLRSRQSPKPKMIICRTIKGKGIPFIEDDPAWHARAVVGVTTLFKAEQALV